MLLNQSMTDKEFFYWFTSVLFLICELILSRVILLILPSSLLAGFTRRNLGFVSKFSL